LRETDRADKLTELFEVASERTPETIERALAAAKGTLGMDVAFVSEVSKERMVFRKLVGDAESFGWREGESIPLDNTFCRLLLEGLLQNVIPDARDDEQVKYLDVTGEADIGCYIGVPITFSDGRLYGTLCALSHSPEPSLQERDAQFLRVLARMVADQLHREELEAQTRRLAVESAGHQALLAALEARDGYSGEHSKFVVELSTEVAQQMDLPEEEVARVRQVALLHDVGKIAVSDSVLRKREPLDEEERRAMQRHVEVGARMVASLEDLAHLAPAIRATHEHWDGTGYPDGLSGEEIPLATRIVHACDAWHAMTSYRPYREALSTEGAIEGLKKGAGGQFDPNVVFALLEVLKTRHPLPPDEGRAAVTSVADQGTCSL
jgi:putative nucleotidyltransferase with HDIG domain